MQAEKGRAHKARRPEKRFVGYLKNILLDTQQQRETIEKRAKESKVEKRKSQE